MFSQSQDKALLCPHHCESLSLSLSASLMGKITVMAEGWIAQYPESRPVKELLLWLQSAHLSHSLWISRIPPSDGKKLRKYFHLSNTVFLFVIILHNIFLVLFYRMGEREPVIVVNLRQCIPWQGPRTLSWLSGLEIWCQNFLKKLFCGSSAM